MTSVNITAVTNTVTVTEGDTTVVTITTAGPQGAAQPGIPTFIQSTQPSVGDLNGATKYAWWDTSGGDLTLWIEDGT